MRTTFQPTNALLGNIHSYKFNKFIIIGTRIARIDCTIHFHTCFITKQVSSLCAHAIGD